MQHGLFVANYPLVDEDLTGTDLPPAVHALRDRCFGITTIAWRLAQMRQARSPNSHYASHEQCTWEIRRTEVLLANYWIPMISSATKSVEEISTVIMQTINRRDFP